MPARLTDLDELVLSVRNKTSREYILEAVDAYRGGAYRSAIVATWIAVFCDLIDKIRSVAKMPDQEADTFIRELDEAIDEEKENDKEMPDGKAKKKKKKYASAFEKDIVKKAKSLELLNAREAKDLEQLRQDRHVCAHPAFVKPEELFQPSPELVRMHIAHAVIHLLQHPPLKGKWAIDSIRREIKEERVFYDRQRAYQHLREKYLTATPDRSIVSGLIARLLEELFQTPESEAETMRTGIHYTLLAIEQLNVNLYKQTFQEQLREKLDKLSGDPLLRVFWLRRKGEQCWERGALLEKHWQKVMDALFTHLERPGVADMLKGYHIFDSLDLMNEEERKTCVQYFSELEPRTQKEIIQRTQYPEFAEAAIELLAIESNPEGADELGREILLPLTEYFTEKQVMDVLGIFHPRTGNKNVASAERTPQILLRFWHEVKHYFPAIKDSWELLVEALRDKESGSSLFNELFEEFARSQAELKNTQQEEHV